MYNVPFNILRFPRISLIIISFITRELFLPFGFYMLETPFSDFLQRRKPEVEGTAKYRIWVRSNKTKLSDPTGKPIKCFKGFLSQWDRFRKAIIRQQPIKSGKSFMTFLANSFHFITNKGLPHSSKGRQNSNMHCIQLTTTTTLFCSWSRLLNFCCAVFKTHAISFQIHLDILSYSELYFNYRNRRG